MVKPTATILLVDDHPPICNGLRAMLEPPYAVVGMVHDGNDVLGMVDRLHPDVVLLDLSLPGQGGLAVTRDLKSRAEAPKVVVITMHSDRVYVEEALRAGAEGYLLKTSRATELRKAVSEVLAGRQHVSPELRGARRNGVAETERPVEGPWEGELAPLSQLTSRQRQVLLLVGQGCSNQEIAERLHLSVKAIEYHRAGIRQVLSINTQAALYRFATLYAATQELSKH